MKFPSAVADGLVKYPARRCGRRIDLAPIGKATDSRHSKRKIENLAKCRNDRKGEWSDVRCFESPSTSDVVLSADRKSRQSGRLPLRMDW